MIPIKFRAWIGSVEEKSMSDIFIVFESERILNPFFDEPIMQFTGLLDKNGKEIYEGDIVKGFDGSSENPFIGEVSFKNCCFEWNGNVLCFPGQEEIEIIGNIYQNPELLK